jgi:hypothetical protein
MYSLIVLGLIPGTQIQINFAMWLIAAAVVVGLMITLYIRRKHFIAFLLLAMRLRITLRRQQLA